MWNPNRMLEGKHHENLIGGLMLLICILIEFIFSVFCQDFFPKTVDVLARNLTFLPEALFFVHL